MSDPTLRWAEIQNLRAEVERLKDESPGWNGAHEVLKQDYSNMEHRAFAAEAALAAARAAYEKKWDADDNETVEDLMHAAIFAFETEHDRFKARGGKLDKMEADAARLREALEQGSRDLWRAWQMLSAINEGDPSADRKSAAEDTGKAYTAARAALEVTP